MVDMEATKSQNALVKISTDAYSSFSWDKKATAPSKIIRPKIRRRIPSPRYSPLLFTLLSRLFLIVFMYAAKIIRRMRIARAKPIAADLGFALGDESVRIPGMVSAINRMESSIILEAMNNSLSFLLIFFMGPISWNYELEITGK